MAHKGPRSATADAVFLIAMAAILVIVIGGLVLMFHYVGLTAGP